MLRFFISDRVVLTVIFINTIALFARGFFNETELISQALFAIEYACTAYFLCEILAKTSYLGWKKYWGITGNRFDFFIILVSLPTLAIPFCGTNQSSVVQILRASRLLRFIRLFRYVPNGEHLLNGILRALKASIGVFLALFLYNVLLAFFASVLFKESSPEHFGNPLLSLYTIFKVFTVEGWYEIPDHIAAASGMWMGVLARAYFVFTVATAGLLGLSLANAIFVDEMILDNTKELEDDVAAMREQLASMEAKIDQLLAPDATCSKQ